MIGTGKTTLGQRLADDLSMPFYDLDQEMNKRLGYSFHRLVAEEGWLAFRELEYYICKFFSQRNNSIICLGGGTVRYDWNVDVLKESGRLILLEASIEELVHRVSQADRPRVNKGTTIEEDISLMWKQSKNKYYTAADYVFRTDEKNIEEEVDELKDLLQSNPLFQGLQVNHSG
jgi:shikimate kinase